MHGNVSRKYIKRSYKLQQLDPEAPGGVVRSAVLSSQYHDPTFCRYRLADCFFGRAGMMRATIEVVRLFVDGEYQGLYLRIEDVDERFLKRRGMPLSSLYKVNYHGWLSFQHGMLAEQSFEKHVPEGDRTYTDLEQLIHIIDRGITEQNRGELEGVLDIDNAIDYYAVTRIIANGDGVRNNYYLYHDPRDGLFRFIPWDLDLTFNVEPRVLPAYENGLFEQLDSVPAYRRQLRRRTRELFDLEETLCELESLAAEVENVHVHDPYKAASGEEGLASIRGYLLMVNEIIGEERETGSGADVESSVVE